MAVLGRLLVSSAERLDLPDLLSIDSYTQGDFKYLMKSFVGDDNPFILKGFEVINPGSSIGGQNISIQIHDSVVYFPGSLAGPFFHGLEEGNPQAEPLVPELRKNTTNYVYLTLTTVDTSEDTRGFWDPDKDAGEGGEFTQDVNTSTILSVDVNVSAASFPENTLPICKVVVGANFIESIEDCRDMMWRLGSGGLNPNPLNRFNWRDEPNSTYNRSEPNTIMTNALDPNPFQGGDKNIETLKEWMDAIMTKLAELGGTAYWYEDTSTFSIVNIFRDSLTTSIKSKGVWSNSSVTPGLLTWTEDIVMQSVVDNRDVIIRSGSANLDNDQVLYTIQERDLAVNDGSSPIVWFNGQDYANGTIGTFENLTIGDWVRPGNDASKYVRVEGFYFGTALSGGTGAPAAAAQSIKLSEVFTGQSGSAQSVYVKGIYSGGDLLVSDRDAAALSSSGGNINWLAMRSDTILNIDNIVGTELTNVDITDHDGSKAIVTSIAHGLQDKQRINIANSVAGFDGEYLIEVLTDDTFSIDLSVAAIPDELGVASVVYATVTTANRLSTGGIQLESSTHGLGVDQLVTIAGNNVIHDGVKNAFPLTDNTFTIPVTAASALVSGGTANSVNIYVRTNIGPENLEQGEIRQINEGTSDNLLDFIGMQDQSQTHPIFSILPTYNTLHGFENYNSDKTDNVTQRLSKLTAMMADKAQDKTIQILENYDFLVNTTNGANQDITIVKNSTNGNEVLEVNLTNADSLSNEKFASFNLTFNAVPDNGNFVIQLSGSVNGVGLSNPISYTATAAGVASAIVGGIAWINPGDAVVTGDFASGFNITLNHQGESITPTIDSNSLQEGVTDVPSSPKDVDIYIDIVETGATEASIAHYWEFSSELVDYYTWYNYDGQHVDPSLVGKTGIEIGVLPGQSADDIATTTETELLSVVSADFSFSTTGSKITMTALSIANLTNPFNGTMPIGFSASTIKDGSSSTSTGQLVVVMPGSKNNGIINISGTLSIAENQTAYILMDRNNAFTVATLDDIIVANTVDVPIDENTLVVMYRLDTNDVYLWNGDKATVGQTISNSNLISAASANKYEELLYVEVGSIVTSDPEFQSRHKIFIDEDGVISADTQLTMPKETSTNLDKGYVVGSGKLEIFVNGVKQFNGLDYEEVGAAGDVSTSIITKQDIHEDYNIIFKVSE